MNKQAVIAVFLVVASIVLFGVFATRGSSIDTSHAQPLRAKQGTMRTHIMPFLSDKQKSTDPGSTDGKAPSELHVHVSESAARKLAEHALNSADPEKGIEAIQEAVEADPDGPDASRLQSTEGQLYLHIIPPDAVKAKAALEQAFALAHTHEDSQYAALLEMDILLYLDKPDEAAEAAARAIEEKTNPSLHRLQLMLRHGDLLGRLGRQNEAESAYQKLLEESLAMAETLPEAAIEQYQLGSLHLAQLYQETGQAGKADTVKRTMRRQLALQQALAADAAADQ